MQSALNKPAFSSFSVIVVFMALMIIGMAFIPLLDVRFKPSRNMPQLTVRFSWANASPKVIEQETAKIEGVLGKISGMFLGTFVSLYLFHWLIFY